MMEERDLVSCFSYSTSYPVEIGCPMPKIRLR